MPKDITDEERDDIQVKLSSLIKPLNQVDAELMAAHFYFSTILTLCEFRGILKVEDIKAHIKGSFEAFLGGVDPEAIATGTLSTNATKRH